MGKKKLFTLRLLLFSSFSFDLFLHLPLPFLFFLTNTNRKTKKKTEQDDGKKGGSEDLLRDLTRATAKALARARGALAALERNAAQSLDAEATRHRADLITANLHLIEPGAASVEVDCWATGERVTIDLTEGSSGSSSSPSSSSGRPPMLLDPPDLAALLYRKARKQRRAEEGTAPRRAQAQEAVAFLEGVEARLAEISSASASASASASSSSSASSASAPPPPPSADLLLSIRDELVAWGHMKPPKDAAAATRAASRARKAEKRGGNSGSGSGGEAASWSEGAGGGASASSRPFRRFVSPNGFEVLLGRNNRENDELSLRVAAPEDLWLHARGVPGSHAVLRVPKSSTSSSSSSSSSAENGGVPDEDLEFAASLAAFFSKAREGGKVPVTFTRAKNVKKPRGAPPGLVTLMSERVVSARPDSVASLVASAAAATAGGGGGNGGSGGASSGSESEGEVA